MPQTPATEPIATLSRRETDCSLKKALLLVLAVLVCFELLIRKVEFRSSLHFRRFINYPQDASRLCSSKQFSVALIGNSSTEMAVDIDTFNRALASDLTRPVTSAEFTEKGNYIGTWLFILNRYFWRPHRSPSLAVIVWQTTDLQDQTSLDEGALAQFFTSRDDWPTVFRYIYTTPAERLDYLLSSGYATYAAATRLKSSIISSIPGYTSYWSAAGPAFYAATEEQRQRDPSAQASRPTYTLLRLLLKRAQVAHMRLCFVAFPRKIPYDLDEPAAGLILRSGFPLVDLRGMTGLKPNMYSDYTGLHLTAAGAAIYSTKLAFALTSVARTFGSNSLQQRRGESQTAYRRSDE